MSWKLTYSCSECGHKTTLPLNPGDPWPVFCTLCTSKIQRTADLRKPQKETAK